MVALSAGVPVDVVVTVQPTWIGDHVRGIVTVKFKDGTLVPNAAVSMTQTPDAFGATFATSYAGMTGSDGTWSFDLSDAQARLPGHHALTFLVTARVRTQVTSGYDVSASPP